VRIAPIGVVRHPAATGAVRALVVNVLDPLMQGRVQVQIPSTGMTAWATVQTSSGGTFAPEVGDEVQVSFQNGDPRYPVVTGYLWNGNDRPPTSAGDAASGRAAVKFGIRGRKP